MSRAFFADNSVALSPKSKQSPCFAPVIACRNAPPCPAIRRVTALTMLFIYFYPGPQPPKGNRLLYVTEKTTVAVMPKRRMKHSLAMQRIYADEVDKQFTQ